MAGIGNVQVGYFFDSLSEMPFKKSMVVRSLLIIS